MTYFSLRYKTSWYLAVIVIIIIITTITITIIRTIMLTTTVTIIIITIIPLWILLIIFTKPNTVNINNNHHNDIYQFTTPNDNNTDTINNHTNNHTNDVDNHFFFTDKRQYWSKFIQYCIVTHDICPGFSLFFIPCPWPATLQRTPSLVLPPRLPPLSNPSFILLTTSPLERDSSFLFI